MTVGRRLLPLVATAFLVAACNSLYGDPSANGFVVNDSDMDVVVRFQDRTDVLATALVAPHSRGRAWGIGGDTFADDHITVMDSECRQLAETFWTNVLIEIRPGGQVTVQNMSDPNFDVPHWMRDLSDEPSTHPEELPATNLCSSPQQLAASRLPAVAGWRSREMLTRYAASTRQERALAVVRNLSPGDRLS